MKISQRLTRAGLAFILFGTSVAMFPTNGNAFAASDTCTTGPHDSIGVGPNDGYTGYGTSTGSLYLGVFPASAGVTVVPSGVTATNGFTASFSATPSHGSGTNGSILITDTNGTAGTGGKGKTQVTVQFSDGHVVTFGVSFS